MAPAKVSVFSNPDDGLQSGGGPLSSYGDPSQLGPTFGPLAAAPQDADQAPKLGPIGMATPTMPVFSDPGMPDVRERPRPLTPIQQQIGETSQRLQKLQHQEADPWGSPDNHPGFWGKTAHVFSTIGNVAGDIFAPTTMALIPGTQMNRRVQEGGLSQRLQSLTQEDADEQEKAAQTKNLEIEPELRQAKAALEQEKQNETENYHAGTLQNNAEKTRAALAQHGFAQDEANPGQLRPLRYEEMSPTQQAAVDLKGAQQEQAEATAALRAAQNDPSSPAFKLAQQRLAVAQQNAQTAMGRLGLSTEEFGFNQEKFYNPQPTASERNKGDLAKSALDRIAEMRQIVQKHPEIFGPVAGRGQNASVWLGSQDPDAQTYQSAAQYLADHSAGVFGGRGQYILSQLHNITDPHSNPEALKAALDEAERAAQGFVQAGTVHGKGGKSGYSEQGGNAGKTAPAPPKAGEVVDGYRFKGGDPSQQKNWEQVKK